MNASCLDEKGRFKSCPYNREIPIESEYVLDEAHSYDVVETEDGYDIVLHFVKGSETDGNENAN